MDSISSFPLSELSPEDRVLLSRYFALNEDLAKLATEPNRPDFLSLLRWLSRPDIAAYIAAYRTHQTHLHRQAVIASLRTVLSSSTDQIEIRRAATTLLRAINAGVRPVPSKSVPPTSMPSFRADRREPTVSSSLLSSSASDTSEAANAASSIATFSTRSPYIRGTASRHAPLRNSFSPPPPPTASPVHPLGPSPLPPLSPPLPATTPTSLSEALAILGLPADLEELDRLDDEADDADDDAELDAYSDWQDGPDPINST